MSMRTGSSLISLVSALPALLAVSCGGGVPLRVRIDEATIPLDLNALVEQTQSQLTGTGVLPGNVTLPELWPASLPDIDRSFALPIPAVPIDLSPDASDPNFAKYEQLLKVADAINRIEINKLALRVERSSISVDIPELTLQVADAKDADVEDRRAWFSIGKFPPIGAGETGDYPFEWIVGGESMLNSQLADETREFALRVTGRVKLDTAANPNMPRGKADFRLIVVTTFFVAPEKAADAIPTGP